MHSHKDYNNEEASNVEQSLKVKVKVEVYSLVFSAKRYSPDFTQLPPGHRTCSVGVGHGSHPVVTQRTRLTLSSQTGHTPLQTSRSSTASTQAVTIAWYEAP